MQSIIYLITVIITLATNFAAVALPLNGKTTQELSDAIKIFFVPQNYVFSIWGLIYIGLIAFVVYAITIGKKESDIKIATPWFVTANIANSVWLFLWHYEQPVVSVLPMLVLFISLVQLYSVLGVGIKKVTRLKFFFTHIPTSLYLGWISVATIANISGALWILGITNLIFPAQAWAGFLIIVAGIIATLMIVKRSDFTYAGVIVWAVLGIALKFPTETPIIVASIVTILMIINFFVSRFFGDFRID